MKKIKLKGGSIFYQGGVPPEDEHRFYSGSVKTVFRARKRSAENSQNESDRSTTIVAVRNNKPISGR